MSVGKAITDAAGIIRGKPHGKAGTEWRSKGPGKGKGKPRKGKPGKTPSSQAERQKLYDNQTTWKDRQKANEAKATAEAKAQGFRRTKSGGYVKIGGAEDERRNRMKAQLAREKAGEKKLVTKSKSKPKKNAKAAKRRKKNTK